MTDHLIQCPSTPAATDIVDAVDAGELWGINMGTTSKASSYSNFVLVECTQTRGDNLFDANPDYNEYSFLLSQADPDSFSESGAKCKYWYLRGMLS